MAADGAPARVEAGLTEHFGHRPDRASVTFVGVEPIEVLRYAGTPEVVVLVTAGMSRRPMTPADAPVMAADGPRAELVLTLHAVPGAREAWRQLAVLAAAPAVESVVYRPGMSVDLGAPFVAGSRCTGALLVVSELPAPSEPAVELLTVLPATPGELALIRARGSDELLVRWAAEKTDLRDLSRAPVRLG